MTTITRADPDADSLRDGRWPAARSGSALSGQSDGSALAGRACFSGPTVWLAVAANLFLSALFAARTVFTVDGVPYFTLFDDAMISMTYARNLARGHGLVWNVGEPVEGYTNLLWTLIMAAVHRLPQPERLTPAAVMLVGALVLAATVVVVYRIGCGVAAAAPAVAGQPSGTAPGGAVLAAWLTAVNYPLIYWTLRGMEVGLVALLVALAVLLTLRLWRAFSRRDLVLLALVLALGLLTRTDALVPCGLVAVAAVLGVRAERRGATALGLFGTLAAVLGAHTAFRLAYYGAPLPATYYLKVDGIDLAARLGRGLAALVQNLIVPLYAPIAVAAVGLLARWRSGALDRRHVLLLALVAAQAAYSIYVGGDAWEVLRFANRYLAAVLPLLFVLTGVGLFGAGGAGSAAGLTPLSGRALVILLLLLAGLALAAADPLWSAGVTGVDREVAFPLRLALTAATAVFALPCLLLWRFATLVLAGRRFDGGAAAGFRLGFRRATPPTRSGRSAALWTGALLVQVVAASTLAPWSAWWSSGPGWQTVAELQTRYALALGAATRDDATIAVVWAGTAPYYAPRRYIDLLGKNDLHIARGPSGPVDEFVPGHTKWDYAYSLGTLRPDVVAHLYAPLDDELVAQWGYERLAPTLLVRADSERVDRAALRAAGCVVPWGNWMVARANPTHPPSEWEARWRDACAERAP